MKKIDELKILRKYFKYDFKYLIELKQNETETLFLIFNKKTKSYSLVICFKHDDCDIHFIITPIDNENILKLLKKESTLIQDSKFIQDNILICFYSNDVFLSGSINCLGYSQNQKILDSLINSYTRFLNSNQLINFFKNKKVDVKNKYEVVDYLINFESNLC